MSGKNKKSENKKSENKKNKQDTSCDRQNSKSKSE